MATPPVPKPRTDLTANRSAAAAPVPLPRTKVPANNEKVSASDILRSIGTVSKQLKEDVATRVSSANEIFEKSIQDGSKFAKGTLEKTLTTSRAVRDSVTKSVIEGSKTAGMKLRRPKKTELPEAEEAQRCVSMPVPDVTLFDNIQFNSPMLEQKRYKNETADALESTDCLQLNLDNHNFDDMSLFSSNSDSNTYISNFSRISHDLESTSSFDYDYQLMYDTPRPSRPNSIMSTVSLPNIPQLRHTRDRPIEIMKENTMYENWTLPMHSSSKTNNPNNSNVTPPAPRPSFSTIYEFDPLNTTSSTPKYEGMSNELLLLESFLTADTYGTIVATDHHEDNFEDYGETDYYNPPIPPERFDSLLPEEGKPSEASTSQVRDSCANWYVAEEMEKNNNIDEEAKPHNSMISRFSRRLKLDSMLHRPVKPAAPKVDIVEKPPINAMPVPYYSGTLNKSMGVADDLFRNTQTRYCVLSEQKLMCYSDPTNGVLKEAYPLDIFYSLQIVLPLSSR